MPSFDAQLLRLIITSLLVDDRKTIEILYRLGLGWECDEISSEVNMNHASVVFIIRKEFEVAQNHDHLKRN